MIPHSRPSLDQAEENAALRVIRSGMLAQGAEVEKLEHALAKRLAQKHAIAVSSGSAALHLAIRVLDLPSNANVLLPSYVCTALLNASLLNNTKPVLGDIDLQTFQLTPPSQTDYDAILAPHMFGHVVDLQAFADTQVPLIEDCALALGATYQNRPVGSHGILSVCSFYATKVLCGGEGGAILTSDDPLATRLRDLRDYDGRADGQLRYNYKLTDLQAAIIHTQLGKLDGFIERRKLLGQQYTDALKDTDAVLPSFKAGEFPFRYVIKHSQSADNIIAAFETCGVSARKPIFCPLHQVLQLADQAFPNTTQAQEHAVSLPLYPSLTDSEIDHVLQAAREIL